MFAVTGAILFIIYHLILLYIGWNGWVWLRTLWSGRRSIRYVYILVLMLLAYSFFIGRWLDGNVIITLIGAYWLALFYFSLMVLPLANLTVFLSRFTRVPRAQAVKWMGWVAIGAVAVLFALGLFNAYIPVVRSYEITIPKKVEGKQELRIAMASDMHFGILSGSNHAKRLVENINALKPDLVLFPGDIMDDDIEPFLGKNIPQLLQQIEAPVYASLGNHDRMHGRLLEALESTGMEVLYDEAVVVDDRFTLIGRKDRRDRGRLELPQLAKQADPSKPVILLDHQPYDFDIAQQNGIDLLVAGHTHRGQIAPGFLFTSRMYENDWGYLQKGSLHTVVSSGYGFWGTPVRMGTRSEIVQIIVKFQS
jgi:uncharacterized protein